MKNNVIKTPEFAIKKLDSIVDETLKELEDYLIYTESDGSYNIFGRYYIKKYNRLYEVSDIGKNVLHNFFNMKNAVAWCIFEYRNKFYDSRRIIDLDRQLASINNDILIHKRLYKKTKDQEREVYELKLSEDLIKRNSIMESLNNYSDNSHYWQINRFNSKV